MDSRWLWAILLLIIVILGGWYLLASPTTTQAPTTEQVATTTEMATTTAPAAMVPAPVQVSYSSKGFVPATVTVVEGQTVTWTNNDTDKMWVASGVHPTHSVYDGTDKSAHCAAGYTGPTPFDECVAVATGGTYSFTFTKAGDWKYHNHVEATKFGEVIVKAAPATPGVDVNASTTVNVL